MKATAGSRNVAYLLGVAFEYDGRAVVTDDLDGDGNVDLLVIEHKSGGGTGDNNDQILHVYQNAWRKPATGLGFGLVRWARDRHPSVPRSPSSRAPVRK